jgi:hypothetical protein
MKTVIASLLTLLSLQAAPASTSTADRVLEQYYAIQVSLASDSMSGVLPAAQKISKISSQAAQADTKTKPQLSALAAAATGLNAPDIKTARLQFGELSKKLTSYLQTAGAKKNPPYQFFCSMAQKGWLQPDKNTRNPYYGSSMLKCGDLIQ